MSAAKSNGHGTGVSHLKTRLRQLSRLQTVANSSS